MPEVRGEIHPEGSMRVIALFSSTIRYNSRQMGRQIQLSMLPTDVDALLTEIRNHAPVEIVIRDEDSADVTALRSVSD